MNHRDLLGLVCLLLAAAPALAKDAAMPADQAAMIEAERAFVRLAAEKGFRDSFYYWFAPDGVAFVPHPARVRVTLEKAPSSPGPMGATWAPVYSDISQAGDLGWNTGPLMFEGNPAANRPESYGMFFSIWEKQADGSWRVVFDHGTDTPSLVVPLDTPAMTYWRQPAKRPLNVDRAAASEELLAVERALLADMGSGTGQAYRKRLSDETRVHRPGVMPMVGRDAIVAWAAAQSQPLSGEPMLTRVARSGDLGYVYGSYQAGGDKPGAGYYARVWKRDAQGEWRIAFDTVGPLPPGVKPLPSALLPAEDLYVAQDWAGAAAGYQDYVGDHPDFAYGWMRLGASQINLRQYPEAIASLERAVSVGGGTAGDFFHLARAHALQGQADRALGYVEKAIGAGLRNRAQYESSPDLASLRDLPRFKELMQPL